MRRMAHDIVHSLLPLAGCLAVFLTRISLAYRMYWSLVKVKFMTKCVKSKTVPLVFP